MKRLETAKELKEWSESISMRRQFVAKAKISALKTEWTHQKQFLEEIICSDILETESPETFKMLRKELKDINSALKELEVRE